MIKTIKSFFFFCKRANYSAPVLILFWLSTTTLFSIFGFIAKTYEDPVLNAIFLGLCFVFYASQFVVGYVVHKYFEKVGYYEAIDTYANSSIDSIALYNWIELIGIIARRLKSFKTLYAPANVHPYDFFKMSGLSTIEQYRKIQTYREVIEARPWLYPRSQHNIFRIQRNIAERLIHEEAMRAWENKWRANSSKSTQENEYWRNILGIAADASFEEAKKAYRKLAMKHHPDRGGQTAKFQEIQKAWQNAEAYYQ